MCVLVFFPSYSFGALSFMISHSDFFGDPGAVVQLDPFPFEVRGEDGPSRPSRDSVSRNRNP